MTLKNFKPLVLFQEKDLRKTHLTLPWLTL